MSRVGVSRDWLSVPVGVAAAATVLAVAPVGEATARLLAITLFCIVLWIATPVPPSVTGMLCIGLIGVVFSTELALTGFQSPTIWLVVFGLLLGEAARTSGLATWGGNRIERVAFPSDADSLSARRGFGRLLGVLCAAAVLLAFLIPSALVRILMISPVLIKLGATFDDESARVGIFLGPLLATFYAAPGIFTAGLPNIITTGIAESLGEQTVSWTVWTVQMFPLMGLGRAAVVTALIYWLYRPPTTETVAVSTDGSSMTGAERRMFGFMLVGVLVWVTDGIHGLHPLFGAMVVVLLALVPEFGVVSLEEIADVDLSIVFFVGAVFAIGTGLSQTGFAETAANGLLSVVPTTAPLWLVLAIVYAATTAMTFLIEGLAVASVLTPVLVSFAGEVGLPLDPILMVESVALGTYFFPYQTVIFVAILGDDVVGVRELIRTAGIASLATTVLLLPLQIGLLALLY
jgi:di/tricarboxylate transporter